MKNQPSFPEGSVSYILDIKAVLFHFTPELFLCSLIFPFSKYLRILPGAISAPEPQGTQKGIPLCAKIAKYNTAAFCKSPVCTTGLQESVT